MGYFYWDPSREMLPFNLPFLERPILWYGFFFAVAILTSYAVLRHLLSKKKGISKHASFLCERLSMYVALGILIGARLGDLLFYQDWKEYIYHPWSVFYIWEGGLASHGGAMGILIALAIFCYRYRSYLHGITWLALLDLVSIVAPLGGAWIRIGNFFNQEILGKASTVPWAIIFGHPLGIAGGRDIPRHPVQLYEAIAYAVIFLLLLWLWKFYPSMHCEGRMAGTALIVLFVFRWGIECFKEEQSAYVLHSFFNMGQWLSLPFIILGVFLFLRSLSKT